MQKELFPGRQHEKREVVVVHVPRFHRHGSCVTCRLHGGKLEIEIGEKNGRVKVLRCDCVKLGWLEKEKFLLRIDLISRILKVVYERDE